MLRRYLIIIPFFTLFTILSDNINARENQEMESVTVLSDEKLAAPLSELASLYARKSQVSVTSEFGLPATQRKRIEDGESADVFITSEPAAIRQLRIKGLVDVYSNSEITSQKNVHYTAVVVAGENMTPARSFLDFLKTPEAKDIFRKNGFTVN